MMKLSNCVWLHESAYVSMTMIFFINWFSRLSGVHGFVVWGVVSRCGWCCKVVSEGGCRDGESCLLSLTIRRWNTPRCIFLHKHIRVYECIASYRCALCRTETYTCLANNILQPKRCKLHSPEDWSWLRGRVNKNLHIHARLAGGRRFSLSLAALNTTVLFLLFCRCVCAKHIREFVS